MSLDNANSSTGPVNSESSCSKTSNSGNLVKGFSHDKNTSQLTYSPEAIEDLYNKAPCGYHSLSADGTFIRINDTELEWLGYGRDEVVDRMNFSDILTEESLNTFQKNFPGFKERGWVRDLEFDLIRKDGTTIPVLLSATAIRDNSGEYLMSRSTVFDISERKKMEKELTSYKDHLEQLVKEQTDELRKSEERFRKIFENHDSVMLLVHPESGAIVDANLAASRYYGYSVKELRKMSLSDIKLLPALNILEEIKKARLREQGCFVVPHQLASGEVRTVEVHSSPIEIRHETLLFSIIHDITDRKRAEEALAESEEKYRLAVATSPDSICLTGLEDGRFVQINDAFTAITGYTWEDTANRTSFDFNLWHDLADRRRIVNLLRDNGAFSNFQAVLRHKSGRLLTCLLSASLMKHNGKSYIMSISRDISDMILAQQEKQELQKQVFESQKMAALGTLVGGIAHDFNNMLQAIMGYSELLLMEETRGLEGKKELDTIVQTARGGADLIKKLLAFSQQANGFPAKLDLNRLLNDLMPLLTHTLPSPVSIDLHLTDEPAFINADPSHVEQVVLNIAINAYEAMPKGGILKISTEVIHVDEGHRPNGMGKKSGNYVLLSFSDNGRGMDHVTLDRIFEPFFSTKQRGSIRGTGMGLSVVKGIVQQHGGYVTCESELGKGTILRVYFPAVELPFIPKKRATEDQSSTDKKTILVIEDSVFQSRVERKFLESYGFTVIVVSTGEEAIKVFEKQKDAISLVILDLILPEMSGRDCLIQLVGMDPSVKVLVASGYSPEEEMSREINPLIKGFLRKPFNASQLIEKVKSILEQGGD